MELSKVRRYRKRHKLIAALFARNPALMIGLNLPFFITTSVSLRAAAALSLELLAVHIGTMAVALVAVRYWGRGIRPMVHVLASTLLMVACRFWLLVLFRGVLAQLGMYVYLMAVNGMTLAQAGALDRRARPAAVMGRSVLQALVFAVVMFLVSLFRELLGNGTLWGNPVLTSFRLPGVLVPFFGFILIGFFLAGARILNKKLLALSLREHALREARFSIIRD